MLRRVAFTQSLRIALSSPVFSLLPSSWGLSSLYALNKQRRCSFQPQSRPTDGTSRYNDHVMLVLEDLCASYSQPCVCDIKVRC